MISHPLSYMSLETEIFQTLKLGSDIIYASESYQIEYLGVFLVCTVDQRSNAVNQGQIISIL